MVRPVAYDGLCAAALVRPYAAMVRPVAFDGICAAVVTRRCADMLGLEQRSSERSRSSISSSSPASREQNSVGWQGLLHVLGHVAG